MKRKIFFLLIGLVILILTNLISCNRLVQLGKSYNEEKKLRFECEEKSVQFSKERKTYEEKISSLSQELEKQSKEIESLKRMLAHQELLNKSLKEELDKISPQSR
ncbi:MAG: hypothetical protein N2Z79_01890 [Candidatus Omnitrophica bacterium]|nr:hypothetical protein [Candidatus Omnitrophota bacterium]